MAVVTHPCGSITGLTVLQALWAEGPCHLASRVPSQDRGSRFLLMDVQTGASTHRTGTFSECLELSFPSGSDFWPGGRATGGVGLPCPSAFSFPETSPSNSRMLMSNRPGMWWGWRFDSKLANFGCRLSYKVRTTFCVCGV